ncbi:hypothetical protein BJV82DRAFT_597311 [Fennellomyces sp. T-0311]|nr:hypothetical protein BJV82DRAFT_597311 [Fennellomyces sp. T-0311]
MRISTIFLLLPSVAYGLSIQRPLPNTIHFANLNLPLSWTVDAGESITSLKVMLAQPEDTIVATLAENVDASKGSEGIKIPKETVSGKYYVVIEGNNTPPSRATRGPISIAFGASESSSSSAAPSSAVSSSASSSASASSSGSSQSATGTRSATSTDDDDETSPTSTSDQGSAEESGQTSDNQGLGSGQVAGIVVGVVGAVLVAGLAAFFVLVRRRKRNGQDRGNNGDQANYFNDSSYVVDAPQQRHAPVAAGYQNMTEQSFHNEPAYRGETYDDYNNQAYYNNQTYNQDPYNQQAAYAQAPYPQQQQYHNEAAYMTTPTTAQSDKPHAVS